MNWFPILLSNFHPPTEAKKSCLSLVTRCYSRSLSHSDCIQVPSKSETRIQLKPICNLTTLVMAIPMIIPIGFVANPLLVTVFHQASVFHLTGLGLKSMALPLLLTSQAHPLTSIPVRHARLALTLARMDFIHRRAILAPELPLHSIKLEHLPSYLHLVAIPAETSVIFVTVHAIQPQLECDGVATQVVRQRVFVTVHTIQPQLKCDGIATQVIRQRATLAY